MEKGSFITKFLRFPRRIPFSVLILLFIYTIFSLLYLIFIVGNTETRGKQIVPKVNHNNTARITDRGVLQEQSSSDGQQFESNAVTNASLQYDVRKMPNCSQYDLFGRAPNRTLEYGEKYREPVWLVEAEFDCKSELRPLAVALILNNWKKFQRRQLVCFHLLKFA